MACHQCDFKGYVEGSVAINNGFSPIIKQCPKCWDTEAYSKRIQECVDSEPAEDEPDDRPKLRLVTNHEEGA